MRKSLLFAFLFILPAGAVSAQAADLAQGRVSLVQGDVRSQLAGSADWTTAAVNTPLQTGDRFWSPGNSRVELEFADGTVIRLDDDSALDILDLQAGVLQVNLSMGHAYVRTGPVLRDTLQVDLPDTSVAVTGPARFRV